MPRKNKHKAYSRNYNKASMSCEINNTCLNPSNNSPEQENKDDNNLEKTQPAQHKTLAQSGLEINNNLVQEKSHEKTKKVSINSALNTDAELLEKSQEDNKKLKELSARLIKENDLLRQQNQSNKTNFDRLLEKGNGEMDATLRGFQRRVNHIESRTQKFMQEGAEGNEDTKLIQQHVITLTKQLETAHETSQGLTKEKQRMEQRIKGLDGDLKKAHKNSQSLSQEKNESEAIFKERNDKLQGTIKDLQSSLQGLQEEKKILQEEFEQLRNQMKATSMEWDSKYQELNKENKALENAYHKLKQEWQINISMLAEADIGIYSLFQEQKQRDSEFNQVKCNLQKIMATQQEKIAKSEIKYHTLQRTTNGLKDQNEQLKVELLRMHGVNNQLICNNIPIYISIPPITNSYPTYLLVKNGLSMIVYEEYREAHAQSQNIPIEFYELSCLIERMTSRACQWGLEVAGINLSSFQHPQVLPSTQITQPHVCDNTISYRSF